MPEQLSGPSGPSGPDGSDGPGATTTVGPPATPAQSGRSRAPWLPSARDVLLLVLGGVVLGALLGALWEWVWTPPTGAAWKGEWYLDPEGVREDVSSTGWFTAIGLVGGVAYGTLAARWGLRRPWAGLLGVVLGSFLLTFVMYHVGHALGPDDPHVVALTTGDWEPIVSDLRLAGVEHPMRPFSLESGAVLAPSIGALVGLVGIFLGGSRRPRS